MAYLQTQQMVRAARQVTGRLASACDWYVLGVASGMEGAALEGLSRLAARGVKVEGYRPLHQVWKRVGAHEARKRGALGKMVSYPRFPSYVFVRFDAARVSVWDVKQATAGFGFVFSAGGHLAIVPDRFVEALRDSEASGDWTQGNAAAKSLAEKLGHKVLIASGPFRDFIGVLRGMDLEGLSPTVTMEVEVFGKKVPVVVDVSNDIRQG